MTAHVPVEAAPARVSTLELFFDLVFVFTITQVTEIIVEHPDVAGLAQAAIVLFVIFWMYGGYAWLTNASKPDTAGRRMVLLAAMAAFFLASVSVPDAFGANGIAFGLAYLAVNVVHAVGFVVFAGLDALRPVLRLFGCNLISAGLVLAAGWVHGVADWVLWLAAVAVQLATPALAQTGRHYRINVEHFTERHGLVILIVLGESLINVALAEAHAAVTLRTAVGILAGLLVAATIWWSYFVGDDDRASAALAAASPKRRATLAITGYFFAHLVMIYGILVLSAGIGVSAPELTARVDTPGGVVDRRRRGDIPRRIWCIPRCARLRRPADANRRRGVLPRRCAGWPCHQRRRRTGHGRSHRRADARRRRSCRRSERAKRYRSPGGLG